MQEISIWSELDHPNILKLIAHCNNEYLLSELCEGSLVDFMTKFDCKLSESQIVNIMLQICDGV